MTFAYKLASLLLIAFCASTALRNGGRGQIVEQKVASAFDILSSTDIFESPFVLDRSVEGILSVERATDDRNGQTMETLAEIILDPNRGSDPQRIMIMGRVRPHISDVQPKLASAIFDFMLKDFADWKVFKIEIIGDSHASWHATISQVPYGAELFIKVSIKRSHHGFVVSQIPPIDIGEL